MRVSIPVLVLIAALLLGVHLAAAHALAEDDSSAELVESWHDAVNAYDVDRSASLFADDAVVVQPRVGGLPQIYVGLEQIRWWHRDLVSQHVHFELVAAPRMVDSHLRWTDRFSLDAFGDLGVDGIDIDSDAVLAQDGRIRSLVSVLTPQAARSIQAGPGGPTSVPDALEEPRPGILIPPWLLVVAGFLSGATGAVLLGRLRILSRSPRLRAGKTLNRVEAVARDPR